MPMHGHMPMPMPMPIPMAMHMHMHIHKHLHRHMHSYFAGARNNSQTGNRIRPRYERMTSGVISNPEIPLTTSNLI